MKIIEKIKQIDPWYALFWIGILITLAWTILKAVGVIKTPIWVEMIPWISVIAAVIGVVKYIVKYLVIIKVMDIRLINLENDMKEVKDERLINLEKHLRI